MTKTSLVLPPIDTSTMTIWHPSTDMGAVGSNTLHQGTQEGSCPPMWQIIGI